MKLLYLSLLSFVFIASTTLAIYRLSIPTVTVKASVNKVEMGSANLVPIPVLIKDKTFPVVSAQSALIIDVDSGMSLYEKNPEGILFPASTTKILTALISLEHYPLDSTLTVGIFAVDGQKMGLKAGEIITVRDLLYGLLVYSANDAAEVLAQNYCSGTTCGRAEFIRVMNEKASILKLTQSNFENPSGLDDPRHITSAKDLARLAAVAMRNPFFRQMVATQKTTVKSVDGTVVHKLTNLNELLGKVEGVMGVKTGWTENARENLVTYVERKNRKIMLVVLGSQDRFGETEELINWAFDSYVWREVQEPAL